MIRCLSAAWRARLAAAAATLCLLPAAFLSAGCSRVDDDRIPSMPVAINLADPGLWNIYGVSGTGLWRTFIKDLNVPSGFPYSANTHTGFGGVLLIGGVDPFDGTTDQPLAYDLSCPVECRRDVRVYIEENSLDAVCQLCESRYNVLTGGGTAISGDAYDHKPRYGLRRYQCIPGQLGGYIIRD